MEGSGQAQAARPPTASRRSSTRHSVPASSTGRSPFHLHQPEQARLVGLGRSPASSSAAWSAAAGVSGLRRGVCRWGLDAWPGLVWPYAARAWMTAGPAAVCPLPRSFGWGSPVTGTSKGDNRVMPPALAGPPEELAGRQAGQAATGLVLPDGPRYPRIVQAVLWLKQPTWFLGHCSRAYGDVFTMRLPLGIT